MKTNDSTTGSLTLEGLLATAAKLREVSILVAFVCRPETTQRVRDISNEFAGPQLGVMGLSQFCGVDVLTDENQTEDCLVFYDREALRVYLARNRRCASTGCANFGARWFDCERYEFFCDGCAQTIKETQPHLPGFSEHGLVKI